MRRPPPQIIRLLLLTVLIVGSYLVARHFLTPPSFRQYGHYRGAALGEIASLEPTYGGRESCRECHAEAFEHLGKGAHQRISCESCHGAARAHTEDPASPPAKISGRAFCLRCHEANPSRPVKHPQIRSTDHYDADAACVTCHKPHNPSEAPQ